MNDYVMIDARCIGTIIETLADDCQSKRVLYDAVRKENDALEKENEQLMAEVKRLKGENGDSASADAGKGAYRSPLCTPISAACVEGADRA